jgi:thiol-disulfide isomerase/thioredoxin
MRFLPWLHPDFGRLSFRTIGLAVFTFVQLITAQHASADGKETGSISGRVVNEQGAVVPDAPVSLYFYDSDNRRGWASAPPDIKSDGDGKFEFNGLKEDSYLVVVTQRGYAKAFRSIVLEKSQQAVNDVTIGPDVHALLAIRDEAGRALEGARLRSLEINGTNGKFLLRGSGWETLGIPVAVSDAQGNLALPPLSKDAAFTAVVDHDGLAPVQATAARATSGVMETLVMKPGVTLEIHISQPGGAEQIESFELALFHRPHYHPSTLVGETLAVGNEGIARLSVEAGTYSKDIRLWHRDWHMLHSFQRTYTLFQDWELARGKNDRLTVHLHRKVNVSGRVINRANGKPMPDALVMGEIENTVTSRKTSPEKRDWSFAEYAETDANGKYTLSVAPGAARITFRGDQYITDQQNVEVSVAADGSTVIPDLEVRPIPPVRGVVLDEAGKPVSRAVVRLRGKFRMMQPTITDELGRFELQPMWIPIDLATEKRILDTSVVALDPHRPLGAEASIRLDNPETKSNVSLRLAPTASDWAIAHFESEFTDWERGKESSKVSKPLGGKPAPELDGETWLNTERPSMSLADFRGKYVLLDFWTTWCGPCHADFPSVKLVHDLYKERGFTVIGVHDNSVGIEAIREHVKKEGLNFPIVVDRGDGRIISTYKEHGIGGYPSYVLIGPDGSVINDGVSIPAPHLRNYKIELVRQLLLQGP